MRSDAVVAGEASARSSRERLIRAGLLMMGRPDADLLRRALAAGEVASTAGVARRTFYDQFETVDCLVGAILEEGPEILSVAAQAVEVRPQLDAFDGDLAQVLDDVLCEQIREARETLPCRVALAATGCHDTRLTNVDSVDLLVDMILDLDREPRAPLTSDDLCHLVQALIWGEAWLQLGQDMPNSRLPTHAVVSLLTTLTCSRGHGGSVDEAHAPVLQDVRIRWRERRGDVSVRNLQHVVVEAAEKELAENGLASTTLEAIAGRVGISGEVVVRYFGTVRELADQIVNGYVPDLETAAERQAGIDGPSAALETHIERVLTLGRQTPGFTAAAYGLLAEVLAPYQLTELPGLAGLVRIAAELLRDQTEQTVQVGVELTLLALRTAARGGEKADLLPWMRAV